VIDFERLARELLAQADTLVPAWLPGGKRSGHEWVCGDLAGNPGKSCSVNLTTGRWADFSADEQGGDLISLYAAIHGLEQLAAARELSGDDPAPERPRPVPRETPPPEEAPEPLLPAPADAGMPPTPRKGTHEASHIYKLPTGAVVGVVHRIREDDGEKTFRQWRWGPIRDREGVLTGGVGWIPLAMPEPRPLYGLQELAARPTDPVMIVEGEKTADAARKALPRYVVVTWPGGAKAWKKAHWQVLADRAHVDIWPDADEPGRKAAAGIALELFRAGVPKVRAVDPTGQPEGWDIADAVAEGWDGAKLVAWARERMRDIEKPQPAKPAQKVPDEPPPRGELIPVTDMAFARRFYNRHGKNIRFSIERGWLVWSGAKWQIDDKGIFVASLAKESAESMLDEIREARDRNEAFKAAKAAAQKRSVEAAMWMARSERGVPARLIDFDVDPMILNVQNGIVDLTTGKLREHAREAMCTMMAGTHFDAAAACPRWQQFIGEITQESVPLMDYLQRLCGYMLTASTKEQCLAFLYGASGRNGKSRFVETMLDVLGDYAIVASPEMIMAQRHQGIPNDIARMRGVRAVFMNETKRASRFDEQKLKDLTGGDKLTARFLREEFFDFKATHKLVIRGNHKPTVSGTDHSIWSRIKLVPFEVNFELLGTMDKGLDDKLRAELPGILNWCVQGCLAWQREGLATPDVIAQAVDRYRNESDTIGRFIKENCVVSPIGTVKLATLYARYKDFCIASSERYFSAREFPDEMAQRGYLASGDPVRIFKGLELTGETSWGNSGRGQVDDGGQSGWL
jgi:putative DNA primase/helicase